MEFHKLNRTQNGSFITHKKEFPPKAATFKPHTIETVFEFAYAMTFGAKGEHRNHRTGGTAQRRKGEIFADTFQGKLAECAACNLFYKIDSTVKPDFSVSQLGVWDSVDVVVNDKKIAVKSTKSFGNLLLLEQHDWNDKGEYVPNDEKGASTYDYFLFIRIKPFGEDIMKNNRWYYSDVVDKAELWKKISKETWFYDYVGYVSLADLKYVIQNQFIIRRGEMLNGTTRMDADNYYIQAGDMREPGAMLEELSVVAKEQPIIEKEQPKTRKFLFWKIRK